MSDDASAPPAPTDSAPSTPALRRMPSGSAAAHRSTDLQDDDASADLADLLAPSSAAATPAASGAASSAAAPATPAAASAAPVDAAAAAAAHSGDAQDAPEAPATSSAAAAAAAAAAAHAPVPGLDAPQSVDAERVVAREHGPFDVHVRAAQVRLEGLSRNMYFHVSAVSRPGATSSEEHLVWRKQGDFEWFRTQMLQIFPGVLVPPAPEKMSLDMISELAVKAWIRRVQQFCTYISRHRMMGTSEAWYAFLSLPDSDLKAVQKTSAGNPFLNLIKSIQVKVTRLTLKSTADIEMSATDVWFYRMTGYLEQLDLLFSNLADAFADMTRRQREYAEALGRSSTAFHELVAFEVPTLARGLENASKASFEARDTCLSQASSLNQNVEVHLRDYIRQIKAALDVCEARKRAEEDRRHAVKLLSMAQAKRDKALLKKVTPKKTDELADLVARCEEALRMSTEHSDLVARVGRSELHHFADEKTEFYKFALRNFAGLMIEHSEHVASVFKDALPHIESMEGPSVLSRFDAEAAAHGRTLAARASMDAASHALAAAAAESAPPALGAAAAGVALSGTLSTSTTTTAGTAAAHGGDDGDDDGDDSEHDSAPSPATPAPTAATPAAATTTTTTSAAASSEAAEEAQRAASGHNEEISLADD